jgi:dipeptidase E
MPPTDSYSIRPLIHPRDRDERASHAGPTPKTSRGAAVVLADLFPSLRDTVYVGLGAGSMVLTLRIGEHFVSWKPRTGDDSTLGVVDFSIFPHLDSPNNTMAEAERWAAEIKGPAYAIDAQTAIKVTDGGVEVIFEGHWKLLNPAV